MKWKKNESDPDVIRTRNLLIWSQTRYRCATESAGKPSEPVTTRPVQHITKIRSLQYKDSHARFTSAEPTPRLASDVAGGKSGQNHPTSHRDPIHIGRMACNAYIHLSWYGEGVLFIACHMIVGMHSTNQRS